MNTPMKAQAPQPPATVKGWIESPLFKDQVAKALPKHITPERMIRVALTALLKTPKLADCTPASVTQCLLQCSQFGLEPDGRRAHLIPYGNVATLIIDYKGLAELAMRSGAVANIHADVVCENDVFDYDRGNLTAHKIDFRQPRGDVFAAYALVRFKDGTEKAEVMTRDEVEAIRKRSRSGTSGPWVTDWNEMAKKTVFRRLAKWLPMSAEFRDAVDVEDEPIDVTPKEPAKPIFKAKERVIEIPAPEPTASDDGDIGPVAPAPAQVALPPQLQLEEIVLANVTFDQFRDWAVSEQYPGAADWGSCLEVRTETALKLLKSKAGLVKQLQAWNQGMKGGAL